MEYITIQNTSTWSLSLSWFILSDKSKDFLIQDDIFIEADEKRVFWRPETKLILNNSDEEIFLQSSTWSIIDSVSYDTSIKWEPLFFIEIDLNPEDNVISNEVELISDEVSISQENNSIPKLSVPDIVYTFQRPSYIWESETWVYICDIEREECKVNFDLRNSFLMEYAERDYICDIDFGMWTLTGQEGRCNPNTVVFPEGEFRVNMKIFHEDDINFFSQKTILIRNIPQWENTQNLVEEEIMIESDIALLKAPKIEFEFQQPSYIEALSENIYVCENGRDECRVNLDFRSSFTEGFSESNYICELDFGFWYITGEENKCNPNTISIPKWEYEFKIKIYHEDNRNIYSEKILEFQNIPQIVQTSGSSWSSSSVSTTRQEVENTIYIFSPKIKIQSGLSGEGRYLYCEKEECKINLNYSKNNSDERCFWDFANMEQSSISTHTRCNPWYVSITKGIHDMSLMVYEKDNEDNRKTFRFYVYNEPQDLNPILSQNISQLSPQGEIDLYSNKKEISINLQWKISKEKTLSGNLLTCDWVEKCYVNLEWIFEWMNSESYMWTLNGKVFSEKINPKGIWVEWEWKHEIIFQVQDIQEIFYVEILPTTLPPLMEENWESSIETKSRDKKAKIRFTQNYLILKYDGLRISWVAPKNSTVYLYSWDKPISSMNAWESGKYRFVSKDFWVWIHEFSTTIYSQSWEVLLESVTGEKEITSENRFYWFQVSSSRSRNTSSSSSSQKIANLHIKDTLFTQNHIEEKSTNIFQRFTLFFMMFVLLGIMLLHMLSFFGTSVVSTILDIYSLRFKTKQKIALIL